MTKPETLSLRQLNRRTLARQMLLERADVSVAFAVERLAGMQAQEPKPPFIGLWTRLNGFSRSDLHTAIQQRELVRATLMRGTLHLVTAADYRAFRAVVEPQLAQALRNIGDRSGELDVDALLTRAREILAERPHTFTEIRARLTEAFPHIHDRALGITVRLLLPLVMYPTDTRWGFPADAAFTLAADWMGGAAHDPTGAPALLVRRYLAAFGPATVADFQEWSGVRGARAWFEELRPELIVFRDERGRELFDLPDAPMPADDIVAPPRFLPEFDNLLLAYADRRRIIDDAHRKDLVTKNGRVRATFLCDGRVCGFWRTERQRAVATLCLMPFERLSDDARAAVAEEGRALLRFAEEDAADFAIVWQESSL